MLAGNLAVVALVVLGWAHARYWIRSLPRSVRIVLFALTMGLGAIGSMSMSVEVQPGIYFDLRSSLMAVTGFFGGLPAAIIAACMASLYRLGMGGDGVWAGVAGIALACATGVTLGLLVRRPHRAWHMVVLGLATPLITKLGIFALPAAAAHQLWTGLFWPTTTISVVATVLAGLVYLKARQFSEERDLLAAALAQAPDLSYVKDQNGRFAATNNAVANFHGLTPEQIVGMTDFDIDSPERAQQLFDREQTILRTGEALVAFEERLDGPEGSERWFSTTSTLR